MNTPGEKNVLSSAQEYLDPRTQDFYRQSMLALRDAGIAFLVGGAYAYARYTGIARHTKDFDIFVRETHIERVLDVLARTGSRTEVTFPHWLGKALKGDDLVDVIHSSGNGLVTVDDAWFANAVSDEVLGLPVLLCPAEEMIWSKAFIMERERFDGADVIHLIHARSAELDWDRLLRRFGEQHWRVLLSHLILFGFVYPGERDKIPRKVMDELMRRLRRELQSPPPTVKLCQGTLLSRAQFLVDVEHWGYDDARNDSNVRMTDEHIAQWTDAIADELRTYGCVRAERDGAAGSGR
jgi:hypothetical protein